jgi:hypothetical protein
MMQTCVLPPGYPTPQLNPPGNESMTSEPAAQPLGAKLLVPVCVMTQLLGHVVSSPWKLTRATFDQRFAAAWSWGRKAAEPGAERKRLVRQTGTLPLGHFWVAVLIHSACASFGANHAIVITPNAAMLLRTMCHLL